MSETKATFKYHEKTWIMKKREKKKIASNNRKFWEELIAYFPLI
jgi:hypothetical protein